MARHCGAMAAREEPEAVVEPGRESFYPEGRGARRGKLDRQRDAVEATTNSGDRGRMTRASGENCGAAARARSTNSRTAP